MAKITAKQRGDLIAADLTQKNKDWNRVASDMNRFTQELKSFAPWKNFHYLNGKGDFDNEDIAIVNTKFQSLVDSIKVNIVEIEAILAIPNEDLGIYLANNEQYLIDNPSIDLVEYDKRYQA